MDQILRILVGAQQIARTSQSLAGLFARTSQPLAGLFSLCQTFPEVDCARPRAMKDAAFAATFRLYLHCYL